mgnify:FL=1
MHAAPEEAGFDDEKLHRATSVLERHLISGGGPIAAASLCVVRRGRIALARTWNEQKTRPFLVASLTKPVTALAALLLVQEGLLRLDARICDYLPEFGVKGKDAIRLRHVLAHTSGLPDMLPQNLELRAAHAPLDEYYARLVELEPLFPPGTQVCYQSMGFLALGRLIESVTGKALPQFLAERLFSPLGLEHTFLGAGNGPGPGRAVGREQGSEQGPPPAGRKEPQPERGAPGAEDAVDLGVPVQLPGDQEGKDWNWNSPYWRNLGAPWGGLLSTSLDLAALIYAFGSPGGAGSEMLAPPLRAAMAASQTDGLPYFQGSPAYGATDSTTSDLSGRPSGAGQGEVQAWGLGWRLNANPGRAGALFGDFASLRAFGHTGATGTAFWYDPAYDVAFCLLTTWPAAIRERVTARVANAVLSAVAVADGAAADGSAT